MSANSSRCSSPSPKEPFPEFFDANRTDPLTGEYIRALNPQQRRIALRRFQKSLVSVGIEVSEPYEELVNRINAENTGIKVIKPTDGMPATPVPWINPCKGRSNDDIPQLDLTPAPYDFVPTVTPCETPPPEAEDGCESDTGEYHTPTNVEVASDFDPSELLAALEHLESSEEPSDSEDQDWQTARASSKASFLSTSRTSTTDNEPQDDTSDVDDATIFEQMADEDLLDLKLDDEPTPSPGCPSTPISGRRASIDNTLNEDGEHHDLFVRAGTNMNLSGVQDELTEETLRNNKTIEELVSKINELKQHNHELRHTFAEKADGDVPEPRTSWKMFDKFSEHPDYFSTRPMLGLEKQKLLFQWKETEIKYWQEENEELTAKIMMVEQWMWGAMMEPRNRGAYEAAKENHHEVCA